MFLEAYQSKFEEELRKAIPTIGEKNDLRDACEYALLCGGKRLRPVIVMMINDALGKGLDVIPAAISAEFFHTASLIADDLPCMDNDDFRRNKPALHKVFGESIAVLASYTLIAEGYGGIYRNEEKVKDLATSKEIALLALQVATRCGGMCGATNGQYLDLYPPNFSWEVVSQVIFQKTVTLFQLSFVFGWLFGGGDVSRLEEVEKCASYLGMAFQIRDDLEDEIQDQKGMNVVKSVGKARAEEFFDENLTQFGDALKKLGLWTEPFQELYQFLDSSRLLRSFNTR